MDCREVDLIAYLKGNPDPKETEAVLDHLEWCPQCQERLQVMIALEAGSRRRSRIRGRTFLIAAAGLFLALLATLLYPLYFKPVDPGSLATTDPFLEFPLEVRDTGDPPHVIEAMKLYRAGRYEDAARHFEQLPDISIRSTFYAGVSYYFAGQYSRAIDQLSQSSAETRWRAPSLWYLANAHLRLYDLQAAEETLRQLSATQDRYSREAGALLERLQRLRREGEGQW